MAICESVSISLRMLLVEMWRFCKFLTVVVCIIHLIPMVMTMGGNTGHPSWVCSNCRVACFVSFLAAVSVRYLSLQ